MSSSSNQSELIIAPTPINISTTTTDTVLWLRRERKMFEPTSPSATSSISIKHYNSLIGEIRCPGCAEPMIAPIRLCLTGHSVCDDCTKILTVCPLCKKNFTSMRSLTLEALAAKFNFPCSFATNGCSVRIPNALKQWHEKRCTYKPVNCFMGIVWGDCKWSGQEGDWPMHIKEKHSDKLWRIPEVILTWQMDEKTNPVTGYYVFRVYDEIFNLYQIYDKVNGKMLWTMTCATKHRLLPKEFAYEIRLCHNAQVISYQFPCHSEDDEDILQDGTCAAVNIADILRFLNDDRILHYSVKVLQIEGIIRTKSLQSNSPLHKFQMPYKATSIEGVNNKGIPSEHIITRKVDDYNKKVRPLFKIEPLSPNELEESGINSDSNSDPELDSFVNNIMKKKWKKSSTPKFNFNRKFLQNNLSNSCVNCSTLLLGDDQRSSNKVEIVRQTSQSMQNLDIRQDGLKPISKKLTNSIQKLKIALNATKQ